MIEKNFNRTIKCPICKKEAELNVEAIIMLVISIISILGALISYNIPYIGIILVPMFWLVTLIFLLGGLMSILNEGGIIYCRNCIKVKHKNKYL